MLHSKRSLEGYVLIDHRNSPGLTEAEALAVQHAFGGPGVTDIAPAALGKGKVHEAPTVTCAHCQLTMISNPLRTRPRGWCRQCDQYLCDGCQAVYAIGFECRSFEAFVDRTLEAAAQATNLTEL